MFPHGSLVDVEWEERRGRRDSDGGKAYIVKVKSGENRTYDVQYIIGNRLSPNVAVSCIRATTLQTTARFRRGGRVPTFPAIVDPEELGFHQWVRNPASAVEWSYADKWSSRRGRRDGVRGNLMINVVEQTEQLQ
jgi:hypothetical protein